MSRLFSIFNRKPTQSPERDETGRFVSRRKQKTMRLAMEAGRFDLVKRLSELEAGR